METEKTGIAQTSPPTPPTSPPSPPQPPSLSSSPAHEFSFTISFHPPTPPSSTSSTALKLTKPTASPSDFDFSPADEIFFHGHLLPLHHLTHRRSNVTIEKERKLSAEHAAAAVAITPASATTNTAGHIEERKDRVKPKSFSSFFALRKWLRGIEESDAEKQRSAKKKKTFHIGRLWKKYASLVDQLLFFKSYKDKRPVRRSSYSFSGDSNPREGVWKRKWRGGSSAPASMRTSPANSGLLVAPSSAFSSTDESTMEELQNAIQAAIAHCKNSVAVKEE